MITQRVAALPENIARMQPMKKLALAALLAAAAIAVTVPLMRAQPGGFGPWMVGGYGGYGMGPGMMGAYGGNFAGALDLGKDQLEKITRIQESFSAKQWGLTGQMREQQFKFRELLATGKADDAAIGKAYRQIEELRQQMGASGAESRKEIDAVLTKAQRDRLRRGWDRDGDGN